MSDGLIDPGKQSVEPRELRFIKPHKFEGQLLPSGESFGQKIVTAPRSAPI